MSTNHKHLTLFEVDTCNASTEELLEHVRNLTSIVREARHSLAIAEKALEERASYVNNALTMAHQVLGS